MADMPKGVHGLFAVTVVLLAACGSEDRQAPTIADFVLELSFLAGPAPYDFAGPAPGVTRDVF